MKTLVVLIFLLSGCMITGIEETAFDTVPLPVERVTIAEAGDGTLRIHTEGHAPDACTTYDHTEVEARNAHTFYLTNQGKRPRDAICLQVLTPYRAEIRLSLPSPGTYRLIFWPGSVDTVVSLPMASQ